MKEKNKLWILFKTTFLISASTSGGYAIASIIKDTFVNKRKWVMEEEMLDLMSIAQSTPGPIAVNISVLVGYRIAGILGAIVSLIGTALPPLIIMSIVASFYNLIADNQIIRNVMKGMSAGVAALLVSVTIDLFTSLTKLHSTLNYVLLILSFLIVRLTNISYFYIAIFCAIAGIIKAILLTKEVQ